MLEDATRAGRVMLEEAFAATQSGVDAYVHMGGVAPLAVRALFIASDDAVVATVRWHTDDSSTKTWLVPFHAIRTVEFRGEWPL